MREREKTVCWNWIEIIIYLLEIKINKISLQILRLERNIIHILLAQTHSNIITLYLEKKVSTSTVMF